MHRRYLLAVPVVLSLLAAGSMAAAKTSRVRIVSPKANSTVHGTSVVVRFKAEGIAIVPATGVQEEGKGHHHLFVDADLTPSTEVVPKNAQVFHLGNGADSLKLENLTPGKHRLIAVLAWGTHIPVAGARTDTLTFTVAP